MELVRQYEKAPSQRMNKDKSSLFFSRNTRISTKNNITNIAGIKVTNSQEKYLGLPTLVDRSRSKEFKAILDKVSIKMSNWKHKFLSQVGKEIMLKSVIQAIPTYSMGVFKLPETLLRQLNNMMIWYWWG